jgi:hypothetical protein
VRIANSLFGQIFGYNGWFTLDRINCRAEQIPIEARPKRDQRRG